MLNFVLRWCHNEFMIHIKITNFIRDHLPNGYSCTVIDAVLESQRLKCERLVAKEANKLQKFGLWLDKSKKKETTVYQNTCNKCCIN